MADFFGGIVDDIRDVGDDVPGFFNAIGRGVAGGENPNTNFTAQQSGMLKNARLLETANTLGEMDNSSRSAVSNSHSADEAGYAPVRQKTAPAEATNSNNVEGEWINRILKFSRLDEAFKGQAVPEKGP